ncbi:MAG: hypothetical protein KHY44_17055 [Clostridiales bacterium]|nr:hypothetical protein [Clostridiales bacterium]
MSGLEKLINIPESIELAEVVEVVPEKGVKIKMEGAEEATNIYFNSYVIVNVGDRVGIKRMSDTIIIEGKLQY